MAWLGKLSDDNSNYLHNLYIFQCDVFFIFCFELVGLFRIQMDDKAIIEISESLFEGNGRIEGGFSPYGIISAGDDTFIALDIIRSIFRDNTQSDRALFVLYKGTVNISQSMFDGNKGTEGIVLFNVGGVDSDLLIEDSMFTNNVANLRMFNGKGCNITINNVEFTGNEVFGTFFDAVFAMFVTSGFISMTNNNYTSNTIPSIVSDSGFVFIESSEFNGNILQSSAAAMIQANDIKAIQSKFVNNMNSG